MSFQLTKLAAALLMPLPLILGLLILGLVLLYLNRARRLSLVALTSGTLLLLLLSVPLLPRQAATAIENDYPRLWMPPDASWVVVLGAGSRPDPSLSPVSRLSTNSLHRLAEGVRLYRQLPAATLIVTGGVPDVTEHTLTTADDLATVAASWGVPPEAILRAREPVNTEAEADAVARWVKPGELMILVTSALHMRRAVALFDEKGLAVVPAPTQGLVPDGVVGNQIPRSGNISLMERSLKEIIGLWWARLRGEAGAPRETE